MRYIISLILIPTFFYPRGWIVPKFASLVAYVFFVCLHSNLIFYSRPTDLKYLLIQLLILGKALMTLVDEMIESEQAARRRASPRKITPPTAKISPQNPIEAKEQSKNVEASLKAQVDSKSKGKKK
jgi:hypothetical protein